MSFKKNPFTFGSKNDAGIAAIPVVGFYTNAAEYTDWFPGLAVYNNRLAKPEYLFAYDNREGAFWGDLVWGAEDCVLCWNNGYTWISEGDVVSIAPNPSNVVSGAPNWDHPALELTTTANLGKTVGVVRRTNPTSSAGLSGPVMVATEGLYKVKVAPTVSGVINRGYKVVISASYPGAVEIVSDTASAKAIGVVARQYLAGTYSSGLIECFIQINVY